MMMGLRGWVRDDGCGRLGMRGWVWEVDIPESVIT